MQHTLHHVSFRVSTFVFALLLGAALVLTGCDSALNGPDLGGESSDIDALTAGKAKGGGAVEWDGNGHYYQAVPVEDGINWFDAWRAAANTNFGNCTSTLATITSQEENDFLASTFPAATELGYWLGGNQLNEAAEPDQGWIWVTGEPFDYTNWATGEPNDLGDEDALHFGGPFFPDTPAEWNDSNELVLFGGYVVEHACPAGRVVEKVTGSGHFDFDGAFRTFSFNARKYANGVVAGEYQLKNRAQDVTEHGDITCLSTDGNEAWLGGIIERNDPIDGIEGSEISFKVIDGGQGRNADPDQLSGRVTFEPGGAAIICRDQLNLVPLFEAEKGNIRVH